MTTGLQAATLSRPRRRREKTHTCEQLSSSRATSRTNRLTAAHVLWARKGGSCRLHASFWSPCRRALADDAGRVQRTSTLAKRLLARKKYPANVNHCFGIKLNSIPLKDQNLLLLTWFQHLIPRHLESGIFHLTQNCQLPLGSDHREWTRGPPSRAAWPSCGTGGARPSGRPRPRDTSHGEAARLTGRPQPSFFPYKHQKPKKNPTLQRAVYVVFLIGLILLIDLISGDYLKGAVTPRPRTLHPRLPSGTKQDTFPPGALLGLWLPMTKPRQAFSKLTQERRLGQQGSGDPNATLGRQ